MSKGVIYINTGKRYLFYDTLSGEIIVEEARDRIEIMPTIERVIEIYPKLSERNRDTFDVIELPYGAYAQDFATGRLVGVDLEMLGLIFEYPNEESPDEPIVASKPFSVSIAENTEYLVDVDFRLSMMELGL